MNKLRHSLRVQCDKGIRILCQADSVYPEPVEEKSEMDYLRYFENFIATLRRGSE